MKQIVFDRHKYGSHLQVDACTIASIPGFIKAPAPHRLGFFEIALVTSGRGHLEVDGEAMEVAPYRVCLTRPRQTRRWRLDGERLDGTLTFFEAGFIDNLPADDARLPGAFPILGQAFPCHSIALERGPFDELMSVVAAMGDEIAALRSDSSHMLRAHAHRLLLLLQRAAGIPGAREAGDPASRLARRFAALIDAKGCAFGQRVADCADALGTTTRTLNRSLQRACGHTAGELIQHRLLLESRRLLLQTDLSIAAIAERLGFSDASYFSRFFVRHEGVPPGRFRRWQESAVGVRNVHCGAGPDR